MKHHEQTVTGLRTISQCLSLLAVLLISHAPLRADNLIMPEAAHIVPAPERLHPDALDCPGAEPRSRTFTSSASVVMTVEPMYSGQAGSWPFETFVRQGAFRLLADYQPHHPRAIFLKQGSATLDTLARTLNNEQILKPYKKGFLLSYPLIIEPGARLLIEHTRLYLNAASGAFISNQGEVTIRHATVSTTGKAPRIAGLNAHFRPFLVSWAGSHTEISDAELRGIGFPGHLTQGLSMARHTTQPAEQPAPALIMTRVNIVNASTGLFMQGARATLADVGVVGAHHDAIKSVDSVLNAKHLKLTDTRNGNAILLAGNGCADLNTSRLSRNQGAGIAANDFDGTLRVRHSAIDQNQRSGLKAIRDGSRHSGMRMLLTDNLFSANGRDGIEIKNVRRVHLERNAFLANGRYAINVKGHDQAILASGQARPISPEKPVIVMAGNRFLLEGKPALRFEGHYQLLLGPQDYRLNVPVAQVFTGNLAPIQHQLFRLSAVENQWVRVTLPPSANHLPMRSEDAP